MRAGSGMRRRSGSRRGGRSRRGRTAQRGPAPVLRVSREQAGRANEWIKGKRPLRGRFSSFISGGAAGPGCVRESASAAGLEGGGFGSGREGPRGALGEPGAGRGVSRPGRKWAGPCCVRGLPRRSGLEGGGPEGGGSGPGREGPRGASGEPGAGGAGQING